MANAKEVEARVRALVDGATEFGQTELAVKMIMRELHIGANDGYDMGYKDAKANQPPLTERIEKW